MYRRLCISFISSFEARRPPSLLHRPTWWLEIYGHQALDIIAQYNENLNRLFSISIFSAFKGSHVNFDPLIRLPFAD